MDELHVYMYETYENTDELNHFTKKIIVKLRTGGVLLCISMSNFQKIKTTIEHIGKFNWDTRLIIENNNGKLIFLYVSIYLLMLDSILYLFAH